MKTTRRFVFTILGIAIIFTSFYLYQVHCNYRFTEVAPNKVYRSAVIPPDKIDKYINKYGIKTVIDLRMGSVRDPLNPALNVEIFEEKKAVEKINDVQYINIPSDQIPNKKNLDQFFKVLDQEGSYPVLIHCHHGTGRAVLYSALYRIQYEGMTNEEARLKTRPITLLSPFDNEAPKGEWLKQFTYTERDNEEYAVTTAIRDEKLQE